MPTFPGAYLTEPSDFYSVATERNLIEAADDLGEPEPALDGASTFADLTTAESSAVVAVWTPVIEEAEAMVNGYLRAAPAGYVVPLTGTIDPLVRNLAARVAWLSALLRRKVLSIDTFESQLASVVGTLEKIGDGRIVLSNAPVSTVTAEGTAGEVYMVTGSTRTFSRTTLEDM
jgi:hypothetical protein